MLISGTEWKDNCKQFFLICNMAGKSYTQTSSCRLKRVIRQIDASFSGFTFFEKRYDTLKEHLW